MNRRQISGVEWTAVTSTAVPFHLVGTAVNRCSVFRSKEKTENTVLSFHIEKYFNNPNTRTKIIWLIFSALPVSTPFHCLVAHVSVQLLLVAKHLPFLHSSCKLSGSFLPDLQWVVPLTPPISLKNPLFPGQTDVVVAVDPAMVLTISEQCLPGTSSRP